MKHKCPVCHKVLDVSTDDKAGKSEFFPFCSQRCKLIDLGAWLDAQYKVISEPLDSSTEKNNPRNNK